MLVGDSGGNLDGQLVDRDWLLRLDFWEGFYQNMDATMKEDVPKIKAEIIHIFSTVEKFNDIVAAAMQVLFLAAFTFCILCNK